MKFLAWIDDLVNFYHIWAIGHGPWGKGLWEYVCWVGVHGAQANNYFYQDQ